MSALTITLITLYFLPTVVGYCRNQYRAEGVLVLNLLLGWTLIGWIGAFIMACMIERKDEYLARREQLGLKK